MRKRGRRETVRDVLKFIWWLFCVVGVFYFAAWEFVHRVEIFQKDGNIKSTIVVVILWYVITSIFIVMLIKSFRKMCTPNVPRSKRELRKYYGLNKDEPREVYLHGRKGLQKRIYLDEMVNVKYYAMEDKTKGIILIRKNSQIGTENKFYYKTYKEFFEEVRPVRK